MANDKRPGNFCAADINKNVPNWRRNFQDQEQRTLPPFWVYHAPH